MNDSRVAKRYAQALALLTDGLEQMESFGEDLDLVCETIYGNEQLREVYTGVQFANADKKQIVQDLFADHVNKDVLHFLLLLVDKMRPAYLADIRLAYHALIDDVKGIADATVYSAYDLSDEEVEDLSRALSQATGKIIRLHAEIEPELLSGIRIRYGDYVIDGSAKAKLETLRKKLMQTNTPTEVKDR